MGRLDRLEVENFKSYQGKQVVGPFDNFTCIIGPNGAGKSNMMDAISFVLGVQSRHLRSTHLKELIFRKDANSPPARSASVKLFYILDKDDDVEGFSRDSTIEFSRNIAASGVSSYYLNGKGVTYEVYESVLLKIGVLVKARNFLVFQGDVETVASKSPLELTKLLEQICGSDNLIKEYEELEKKREVAEENSLTSNNKRKMYLTQSKEIKSQKDEADFFQLKQEELAEARTEHCLWQIWRIKDEIEDREATKATLAVELAKCERSEITIVEEIDEGKNQLAGVNKEILSQEKVLQGHNKVLEKTMPKLSDTRVKLKSLEKKSNEYSKRKEREEADLAEHKENLDNLKKEIASTKKLETKLNSELSDSSSSEPGVNKLNANDWTEHSRLRGEVSARSAVDRANEMAIDLDLKGKQHQLAQLEGQHAALLEEMSTDDKLIQTYSDGIARSRKELGDNQEKMAHLREESDKRQKESQIAQRQLHGKHAELEELSVKLRNAGDDKRRNKQEDRMSEAIKSMQLINKGVYGKLFDFCRPMQKKYNQAMMVAAGKNLDAIIVDTTQTATECMKYLKEQKVGICQFLPLDNISFTPINEKLRTFGSKCHPLFDLLEFEDQYRAAVLYAVGSTIVCDTLEDAQHLCFVRGERVKAVTLAGQVISKSGAMTGGTAAGDSRQDRWAEKEIEALRSQHGTVSAQVAELEQIVNNRQYFVNVERSLKEFDLRIKNNNSDIKVFSDKLSEHQRQRSLHADRLSSLTKEINALKDEIGKLEKQLTRLQNNIRDIENEVFQDFYTRRGVTNIREYEEQTLKKQQKVLQQHSAVTKKLASLTSQLEFEENRKCSEVLEKTKEDIKNLSKDIEKLQNEEQKELGKELEIRAEIRGVNEAIQKLKNQKQAISQNMNDIHNRRNALQTSKDATTKKIATEDNLLERLREHIHEVLQKAQVDEVSLPAIVEVRDKDLTWSGNISSSQLFSSSSKRLARNLLGESTGIISDTSDSSSKEEGRIRGVSEKNEVACVDLSSMRKYKNLPKNRRNDKEEEISKKISDIVNELSKMQPNMHAAKKYEEILIKLKECNDECEATKEVARDFTAQFEEVKKARFNLFSECYDHVSQSLGAIYKDLTKSSKHPLGGTAYLTLENTDEPFLGGIRFTAMPPMKRFRDMEQLSGGEKTMAALALLFSIHSFRQAPFFVLDEVDAALDNVNVKKLCNYISKSSKHFQCIVISLKDMFFEHADSLVGICKDVTQLSSQVMTLDLRGYGDIEHRDDSASPAVPASPALSSLGGSKTSTPVGSVERIAPMAGLGKRRSVGASPIVAGGRRISKTILAEAIIEESGEDQDE